MTQTDYEQIREQEWKAFCNKHGIVGQVHVMIITAFFDAFDRAYSLGKVKDLISQDEIDKAAVKSSENKGLITGSMTDEVYQYGFKDGANYSLGKQEKTIAQEDIEKAAEAFATPPIGNGGMFTHQQVKELLVKFAHLFPGKQEKDAEETSISERLYEEEKSQLEGLYHYLNRAADTQENDSVSVAILFEVMERMEDMFGIDLLTNGHGKPTEKDTDTVIQGWVAVDEAFGQCFLHTEKPIQKAQPIADTGDYNTVWDSKGKTYLLDTELFPDIDSDSDSEPVEIIIKRKKNGD